MAEKKWSLKMAAVDAYSKTFGDFSKKAELLNASVREQRAEISKLNRTAKAVDGFGKLTEKIEQTRAAVKAARIESAALGREHRAAVSNVARLEGEYAKASASLKALEASGEATTAQVKQARLEEGRLGQALAAATLEVKRLDQAQDKSTASVRSLAAGLRTEGNELKRLQAELTAAGVDTSQLASEQKRLESATEQANAALASQRAKLDAVRSAQGRVEANRNARADLRGQIVETAAVGYLAAKPVSQAYDLDLAMADVAKVVAFEGDQREKMAQANLKMATEREIAVGGLTAVDLTQIQAAAGQSGVGAGKSAADQQAEIIAFTRDAAIMASAFGMEARDAGETMAGWRASMNLDQAGAVNLANASNHLSNSGFNAKAGDIASVMKRYGAIGQASGLMPQQSAALAAALLNPGTEKEIAGTGMKNFLGALTKGSAATKGQRETWDELGFDPEDLAQRMQEDAPAVIMEVLEALKSAPEAEQSALATKLFGSESIGAIMPLLQNLGAVDKAFKTVSDQAKYSSSMMDEASGVAASHRAGWDAFTAKLTRLSTLVGNAMMPAVNAALIPLGALVDMLADGAETFPGITSAIAIAGGGLAALKVGALGLKFAGLLVGQAFNKGALARAKLDATTTRTALTADAAVLRLNAAMARLGAGGGIGGDLGDGKGGRKGGRAGGRGGRLGRLGGGAMKLGAPLMLAAGAYDAYQLIDEGAGSEAIGESVGSTAGGMGGMWAGAAAGAAIGSVVPIVGTAIGGLLGGALGAWLGSEAGGAVGEWAGGQYDRLSSPDDVAQQVSNADNRQITFAPVLHVNGADAATSNALADQVLSKMRGEFVPLMMADPLAIRRGASLTDGGDG
ncbi:TPA: phage tail tape measure protein [Pseudomonas aeruginosa]|nr:phage tail tape measure protein [Pseudomonas aeruginosa]HEC1420438.1 phage tail tape measure protein [Pseudomonas aeruginosa]